MKKCDDIILSLLAFPVVSAGLSMAGFAFALPISHWHAPVGLVLSIGFLAARTWHVGWKPVLSALSILIVAFVASSLPVGYAISDSAAYHHPASILLANGWNPLIITEPGQIESLMGGGFRPWHVAFLPRLGWIYGAVLYKWFGFVEIADSLKLVLWAASFLAVNEWLKDEFALSKWCRRIIVLALCISPVVVGGIGGSPFGVVADSCMYSAFLIAMTAVLRGRVAQLALAVVLMSGLKYTGVVMGVMIFSVSMVFDLRNFKRLFITGLATGALVLIVNASPYLTSWKNHGGPFYPSHSFVESERFDEKDNPITPDFCRMNEDAEKLGYVGRFAWAYVSQTLVKRFYAAWLDKPDFNPVFDVPLGVGGYGTFFRVLFLLSLVGWCFVRKKGIHMALAVIMLSTLCQPTTFMGYARYAPQLYLFPWLVALGLSDRFLSEEVVGFRRISVMSCGWCVLCVYALVLLAYPMSFIALQWINTVQSLQIIRAAQHGGTPVFKSRHLSTRQSFSHDIGIKAVFVDDVGDDDSHLYGYRTYFWSLNGGGEEMFLADRINGFWRLEHIPASDGGGRNAKLVRFFVVDFLPRESLMIPMRLYDTICLRLDQFRRAAGTR